MDGLSLVANVCAAEKGIDDERCIFGVVVEGDMWVRGMPLLYWRENM